MEVLDNNPSLLIPVASEREESTRAEFIRKTYTHVAIGVLVFMAFEVLFLNLPFMVNIGLSMASGWTWLLLLAGFSFASGYAERMAQKATDKNTQYVAMILFCALYAFVFLPLIYVAMMATGSTSIISQAGIMALALFGGLTAIVFVTKKDFSFLRSAITIGSVVAMGLIVAGILFGFNLGLWFSAGMVILAAGSILYQTSAIQRTYHKQQYVAASLGLLGSLLFLFYYILNILLSFSGD